MPRQDFDHSTCANSVDGDESKQQPHAPPTDHTKPKGFVNDCAARLSHEEPAKRPVLIAALLDELPRRRLQEEPPIKPQSLISILRVASGNKPLLRKAFQVLKPELIMEILGSRGSTQQISKVFFLAEQAGQDILRSVVMVARMCGVDRLIHKGSPDEITELMRQAAGLDPDTRLAILGRCFQPDSFAHVIPELWHAHQQGPKILQATFDAALANGSIAGLLEVRNPVLTSALLAIAAHTSPDTHWLASNMARSRGAILVSADHYTHRIHPAHPDNGGAPPHYTNIGGNAPRTSATATRQPARDPVHTL